MKEFEEIQKQWQNQAHTQAPVDGAAKIIEKTNYLKKGQRITNWVLSITVAVLIMFFFYVKAYLAVMATWGLALMAGGLIFRIVLEFVNLRQLKSIKYDLAFELFKQKITDYYKTRLKTHYYITPFILGMYSIGFLMLMPFFKEGLSPGFYLYIKVSAVIIFVLGIYLIFKQIKKELLVLRSLIAE